MTNVEFQQKLKEIYASHDIIGKSERKTVNELLYMLRMDDSVADYNINLIRDGEVSTICIPSVKLCFVPLRDLVMHVKEVECEEFDYGFDGLCLNVYVEE